MCITSGDLFSTCLAVSWLVIFSGSAGHHQLLAGLLIWRLVSEWLYRCLCSLLYNENVGNVCEKGLRRMLEKETTKTGQVPDEFTGRTCCVPAMCGSQVRCLPAGLPLPSAGSQVHEWEPSGGSGPYCLLCPPGATEQQTAGCGPSQGKGRNISSSYARTPVCHLSLIHLVLHRNRALPLLVMHWHWQSSPLALL